MPHWGWTAMIESELHQTSPIVIGKLPGPAFQGTVRSHDIIVTLLVCD